MLSKLRYCSKLTNSGLNGLFVGKVSTDTIMRAKPVVLSSGPCFDSMPGIGMIMRDQRFGY